MSDVAPNDPAIMSGLIGGLQAAVDELKNYLQAWDERVDALVVQLQNAASATVTPEGSVTGSVPESGPGAVTTSSGGTAGGTASFYPSSTSSSHTITDPSGDDTGWSTP